MRIKRVFDGSSGQWLDVPMTQEEEQARDAEELLALIPSVPHSVTPYQARRALTAAGLRSVVESWIESQDEEIRDAWQYGLSVDRNNPILAGAATALNLTQEQLDDLFRLAVTM